MLRSAALAALSLAFAPVAMSDPQTINCTGDWAQTIESLKPRPEGPATLSAIRCLPLPQSGYPVSLSPDGSKIFSFHSIEGLWIGGLNRTDASKTFPGRVRSSVFMNKTMPFEWLADSSEVIGVKRNSNKGGFALGPLQPYLFSNDGRQTRLPALSHPNGPLDEIFWIGGAGLAFATFGTKGAYYNPEHEDPNPTISLVDAKAGQVLEDVETAAIAGLPSYKNLIGVSSRIDKSGRARVLTAWLPDTWMLWDQGDSPRILPIHNKTAKASYTLSMDGTKVLIMGNLSATGWICEFHSPCPSPTPQSGMIAELRDVSSGRLVWSIMGTANQFSNSDLPAISPDDQYALITMPGEHEDIGLVSMTDGSVLQRFRMPGWGSLTLGFSSDGKQAWITGGATMATFDISPQK